MLKDRNEVLLSGKIFWSKLDEKPSYSMLRLGIDAGHGEYNRIFAVINNPNQKAYQYIKNDNQVVLMGAWLDVWKKDNGELDLQIKGYDSNIQFYLPEKSIPNLNEVIIYGKIKEFDGNQALIDCIGKKNPKTGEYTHRIIPIEFESSESNIIGKKIMIKGTLGTEQIGEKKSKLKVFVDYDNLNIMD